MGLVSVVLTLKSSLPSRNLLLQPRRTLLDDHPAWVPKVENQQESMEMQLERTSHLVAQVDISCLIRKTFGFTGKTMI